MIQHTPVIWTVRET